MKTSWIKESCPFPDLGLITLPKHCDSRGSFQESFNLNDFKATLGFTPHFVQDNIAHSKQGVLRGLHYQYHYPQGKLIHVIRGKIYDVVVDLRQHSPTFAQWYALILEGHTPQLLWIPTGFAHGYYVLSDETIVAYKTTTFYAPSDQHCLAWNDPTLAIKWPITTAPILSTNDQQGLTLQEIPLFN